jgi:hypothetical protein
MAMKRRILFLAMVVLASPSPAQAGRKPAPKPAPVHPAAAEIKRVAADIEKLKQRQQAEVVKVQARYAAQVAQLNLAGLHSEIARLQREKKAAIHKKVPAEKLQAIQNKYQPLIKKVKAAQAQTASLAKKKKAELAKIRADYAKQIAKLDPPEGKLEVLLAQAATQAAVEGYKLIEATQAAQIKPKFQKQINTLRQQIRSRDALIPLLDKQVSTQAAAIRGFYQARILELDLATENPGFQQVRLLEAKAFKLAKTSDPKLRSEINAVFNAKLANVQKLIDVRNESIALLVRDQNAQLGALSALYDAELAKIVPPGVILEAELYLLWSDQSAAIVDLIAAAELEAYRAKYLSQVESLKGRVKTKQAQIVRLNNEMNALTSKVEAAYVAQVAALNPVDNLLEYQLVRLQEQQWLETLWLIEPPVVAAILDGYDPLIAALTKQLGSKHQALAPLSRQAMADVNRITNDYNRAIAGLQQHIARLMSR